MPTYDYVCGACGHEFEHFQAMTDRLLRKCPKCGKSRLVRRIGAGAGLIFKGSGFYETDYKRAPAAPGSKPADGRDASKSDGDSSKDAGGSSKETGGSSKETGGSSKETGGSSKETGGSSKESGGDRPAPARSDAAGPSKGAKESRGSKEPKSSGGAKKAE